MKRTGIVLAAALAAAVGVAQEKTAVVNMIDLARYHPNGERDRKLMADMQKDLQAKLDKQLERLDQLRDEYSKADKEARNPALSEKARVEAENKAIKTRNVLAEADRDLRQEHQKSVRDLEEQDARLLRQVMGEIREKVTAFAKDNKYTVVMDGSTLAYFDPKLDVTDEILKKLGVDPKVRKAAEADAKTDGK